MLVRIKVGRVTCYARESELTPGGGNDDLVQVYSKNGHRLRNGLTAVLKRNVVRVSRHKESSENRSSPQPVATRSWTDKQQRIIELFMSGLTLREIGEQHKCSHQYIHQVIQSAGLSREDGGAHADRLKRKTREILHRPARRAFWIKQLYGCEPVLYDALMEITPNPILAYTRSKVYAQSHDIGWGLNLAQWWSIWLDSGRWEQRGREADRFCMGRLDLSGPYTPDNCYIDNTAAYRARVRRWGYGLP